MKTILIADRDNKLRNLVRLMFTESMGYRVLDTASGKDAVLKAYAAKPDIVLADVSLSDKSGYEVSREIKDNPLLKNTVVILLADSYETFDEIMSAEAYSDDFILKPFGAKEITDKLEPFLARRKGKERFKISGLVSADKLKSLISVPRLTIERKVIFRGGMVALVAAFVLVLAIAYRVSDVKLSKPELSSWLNGDLLGDMSKSILPENILKREAISLIKEENSETSSPVTEVPALAPSLSPSENIEPSFKPEAEKGGVNFYGWEEKGVVEKPEGLKPKEEIPMSEEMAEGNRYVVKKGDSLWTISQSFNTSVDGIRAANNLESDSLDVGDVLIIPTRNGVREPEGNEGKKAELVSVKNKEMVTKQDKPAVVIKKEDTGEGAVPVPAAHPNGEYSVQVGAFQAEETAGGIVDKLISKGYPAFIRTVDDPIKGRWHMIRIGRFKTMEDALAYGNQVNQKEEMVDEAIVVSENTGESKRQISQRPKQDELPAAIREEEADMNSLRFEEINGPDFEEEKSRILEEIKRDKVLKDIEEKVREKDVEEGPPVEFNASDLGTQNTSVLSRLERQTPSGEVTGYPDSGMKAGSVRPNNSAENIEQRYWQDYLENVQNTKLEVGISDRNVLGPE